MLYLPREDPAASESDHSNRGQRGPGDISEDDDVAESVPLRRSSKLKRPAVRCVIPKSGRSVKVTYLGIRSAHECVWPVERKPIWLPRAYLMRGDLDQREVICTYANSYEISRTYKYTR